MKRILLFLTVFTLLFSLPFGRPAVLAEGTGDAAADSDALVTAFAEQKTISALFSAAEKALEKGTDPASVYDAMFSAAENNGFLRELQYALENASAYGSALCERMAAVAGGENRNLDSLQTPLSNRWSSIDFDPYGHYSGSDAFMEMIADPGAGYCLNAGIWKESDFSSVFGTPFSKFKPARPRAGYVCVVVTTKSVNAPETAWDTGTETSSFVSLLQKTVNAAVRQFDDGGMKPVFTGNPDLASSFWVFELTYPFRGWYGSHNRKEIRGFNCSISLTVYDAPTHRLTAKAAKTNRLPNTIYYWHDGISEADIPSLEYSDELSAFASKAEKAVEKQFETEDTSPRLTPVSCERAMDRLLKSQAETLSDPWQKAICESGVRDVQLLSDSVTFSIRSFDPRLKELGTYAKAENREVWLQAALENASAYSQQLTLPVESGRLTKKAKTTLNATLKKAATTAQTAFGGKDFASALSGLFFPVPVEGKITDASALLSPSDAFASWYASRGIEEEGLSLENASLLCYAQKSLSVNAKTGPHALEVTCTGADPASMLTECLNKARDTIAYAPADSRASLDQAVETLNTAIAGAALAAHTKSSSKYTFAVDVDELARGEKPAGYRSYLSSFTTSEAADQLRAFAEKLPDAEALKLPKSAKLTGPTSGTKVTFDLSAAADPAYVQLRSSDGSKVVASAFVYAGKKVTVQVPAGYYKIAFCSGRYWYGEELLFASLGEYYLSESTQILEPKYSHTFTLNPADEDELLFFEASPADFQ